MDNHDNSKRNYFGLDYLNVEGQECLIKALREFNVAKTESVGTRVELNDGIETVICSSNLSDRIGSVDGTHQIVILFYIERVFKLDVIESRPTPQCLYEVKSGTSLSESAATLEAYSNFLKSKSQLHKGSDFSNRINYVMDTIWNNRVNNVNSQVGWQSLP